MTIKDQIVTGLAEMRLAGEINEYVEELLLTRIDNMAGMLSEYDSFDRVVYAEMESLNMDPGYTSYGEIMTPISREEALRRYDADIPGAIYRIYSDDSEGICERREDIESGNCYYAVEHSQPQSLVQSMQGGIS